MIQEQVIGGLREIQKKFRSKHWSSIERTFLGLYPKCSVCGCEKGLNVHHKKPFHLYPELELATSNLITLCRTNGCHFLVGHLRNWKSWNKNVEVDANVWREKIKGRP